MADAERSGLWLRLRFGKWYGCKLGGKVEYLTKITGGGRIGVGVGLRAVKITVTGWMDTKLRLAEQPHPGGGEEGVGRAGPEATAGCV